MTLASDGTKDAAQTLPQLVPMPTFARSAAAMQTKASGVKPHASDPHFDRWHAMPVLGAYMHHTLNTSLIYFNTYPICSNFHQKIQNYSKIFFLIFLYFYSRLFECSSIFLSYV